MIEATCFGRFASSAEKKFSRLCCQVVERTGPSEDPGCCKALTPGGWKDDRALSEHSSRERWGTGKLKALARIRAFSYTLASRCGMYGVCEVPGQDEPTLLGSRLAGDSCHGSPLQGLSLSCYLCGLF